MSESESNQPSANQREYEKSTRERLLGAIHTLSEPTKISAIAEMADCSDQGARNILRDFEEMGVVTKVAERPIKYDKNDAYFRFRRGQELAADNSDEELVAKISDRWNKHQEFQNKFGTHHPAAVNVEQLESQQGEDELKNLRQWSTTYQKLQDYLEALEQKRNTKLMLDRSISVNQVYQDFESNMPSGSGVSNASVQAMANIGKMMSASEKGLYSMVIPQLYFREVPDIFMTENLSEKLSGKMDTSIQSVLESDAEKW